MATMTILPSSAPQNTIVTRLPPRRGQIKAQIFESLARSVVSTTIRAGSFFRRGAAGSVSDPSNGSEGETTTNIIDEEPVPF